MENSTQYINTQRRETHESWCVLIGNGEQTGCLEGGGGPDEEMKVTAETNEVEREKSADHNLGSVRILTSDFFAPFQKDSCSKDFNFALLPLPPSS